MLKKTLLLSLSCLVLSACTWVRVSSEGEGVAVLTAAQAENRGCQRLGQTNTQTMNKVLFYERSKRAQTEELEKLAKNEAANMGGNAVVAEGEIVDGRQMFVIYQCQ